MCLFSLHFHIAVLHQRKLGQELTKDRILKAGILLTGLCPLACIASFLIESRIISLGMAPIIMGPPTLDH